MRKKRRKEKNDEILWTLITTVTRRRRLLELIMRRAAVVPALRNLSAFASWYLWQYYSCYLFILTIIIKHDQTEGMRIMLLACKQEYGRVRSGYTLVKKRIKSIFVWKKNSEKNSTLPIYDNITRAPGSFTPSCQESIPDTPASSNRGIEIWLAVAIATYSLPAVDDIESNADQHEDFGQNRQFYHWRKP